MSVKGVIMAGGRSERMRASGETVHKALVEVAGTTLLEHNVRHLARHGITDVGVVVSAENRSIRAWIERDGRRLEREAGVRIDVVVEERPLGNIGIVRELTAPGLDLLVCYVDNLCLFDLRAMLDRHVATGAALTLATHRYALRNAFGELRIEAGKVIEYREKPVRDVSIASGTCVVAPSAAAAIPADRAFGAYDLVAALRERGVAIAAFEHDSPWIDVNDRQALLAARGMYDDGAFT